MSSHDVGIPVPQVPSSGTLFVGNNVPEDSRPRNVGSKGQASHTEVRIFERLEA